MLKKLIAATLLCLSLSSLPALAAWQWFTNGLQTNPVANAILADTGLMPGAAGWSFQISISATVPTIIWIELVDGAGTTLGSFPLMVPASSTVVVPIVLNFNEPQLRVRCRLNTTITGLAHASIRKEY